MDHISVALPKRSSKNLRCKFASTSGSKSRMQAAMKTPPEKHEQKLMKFRHHLLEPASWLCLRAEKSLRGSIPKRKVIAVMARIVNTFSVLRPMPAKRPRLAPSCNSLTMFSLLIMFSSLDEFRKTISSPPVLNKC